MHASPARLYLGTSFGAWSLGFRPGLVIWSAAPALELTLRSTRACLTFALGLARWLTLWLAFGFAFGLACLPFPPFGMARPALASRSLCPLSAKHPPVVLHSSAHALTRSPHAADFA